MSFAPVRVTRRTAETEFEIAVRPRRRPLATLPLPNRLLSHFLDHLGKGAGFEVELVHESWPGSWRFDHVLCEDLGQLIGHAVTAIHDAASRERGVPGRAETACCMDDAESRVVISFEGRPSARWSVPEGSSIDGFVDAWYDESGRLDGYATGTNLRQFVDGFALGSGASVSVTVVRVGNLHHLYETVFRALGDAIATAADIAAPRQPGDGSGLAGAPRYVVRTADE